MELKLQSKVSEHNRQEFYNTVYPHASTPASELIQLDKLNASTYVIADSCGWYYKTVWPDANVISLETLSAIKEYKLERFKFQGMIDNRDHTNIKWPTIDVADCALIFDRCPILKYRTVTDIVNVISGAATKYNPKSIIFNASATFIDDPRLTDRISVLASMLIPGYVVINFSYDTVTVKISYKKKLDI